MGDIYGDIPYAVIRDNERRDRNEEEKDEESSDNEDGEFEAIFEECSEFLTENIWLKQKEINDANYFSYKCLNEFFKMEINDCYEAKQKDVEEWKMNADQEDIGEWIDIIKSHLKYVIFD